MQKTSDINVVETRVLPSPAQLLQELPKTEAQAEFVTQARADVHRIIFTDDKRFLLIVGPCSIHDIEAGRDYARRLAALAREVSDRVMIVMRVYFEKPRTTVGWKGLILDPHLDGSHDIAAGLRLARSFLLDILKLGLPTATEMLDPITPQYISDLICWSAIGARTAESQTHRQMASGLSMPLGFKNGTDGSIRTAVNAIKAASQPHTFLGINLDGAASAVVTRGNPNCHIVLRGGGGGPNYSADPHRPDGEAPAPRRACPRPSWSTARTTTRPSSRNASPRSCAPCWPRSPPGETVDHGGDDRKQYRRRQPACRSPQPDSKSCATASPSPTAASTGRRPRR